MRVLVIGGSGFISGEVARQALEAGHELTLFHRGQTKPAYDAPAIHGDASRLGEHREALRARSGGRRARRRLHRVRWSRVGACLRRHRCALDRAGLDGRLRGLSSGRRRTRHRSAAGGGGRRARWAVLLAYWREHSSAKHPDYDKNQLASVVLAAHESGAVRALFLRLPMVWGPRDRQFANRHGEILRRIVDGRRVLVMGHSVQNQLWPFGYVENVAAAIVHCFAYPGIEGSTFNLGESRVRSWRAWAELYARVAGVELEVRLLPDELLDAGADAPPRHLVFDCTRFPRETAFVPPVAIEEAARRTLRWVRENSEALGPVPDYEHEERQLAAWGDALRGLREIA